MLISSNCVTIMVASLTLGDLNLGHEKDILLNFTKKHKEIFSFLSNYFLILRNFK